ncbi:hypothetical protein B0F90DRAFT_598113 [Multifurca ochricompacta]|uniref:Uncharacterized protein n=1 Tax=Multifurca ochricompacta TaxID=376703 RepID=A0AAD4M343_9AGAM|nr:hypothetical protein B0F90DRAFT_598113 [Multifurca ochricompacta]
MANWHDPVLVLRDYLALIKLDHALSGIYIWETLFTAGFELDVLKGKRPYRWTIWIYLGTRYTTLLAFIIFFIDTDGPNLPCKPFVVTNFALPYASWAFASLIIVLRVIAIWNRNIFVSLIAVGSWLGGLGLNLWNLTMVESSYNPILETCITLKTHRGLLNVIGILAVDVVLLVTMLIGLLRYAHRSSTGIWYLLYQQCIIWLFLAAIAEVPPVVFLSLDLNDPWNGMLIGVEITILSIGTTRMYRALSEYGSITEYMQRAQSINFLFIYFPPSLFLL